MYTEFIPGRGDLQEQSKIINLLENKKIYYLKLCGARSLPFRPWVGVGLHIHRSRDDVDAQTQGSEAADKPVEHRGRPRLLRAVIRSCCYDVKIVVYMFHYLDLLKKSWPDWQCFPLRQQRPLRLLMRLWVAAFWSGSPHYLISLQLSP